MEKKIPKNIIAFCGNDTIHELNINILKEKNKEYNFFIYREIDYNFIQKLKINNFEDFDVKTKSEIFIYCILYNYGGVLIDPFYRYNEISLEKEIFCRNICICPEKHNVINKYIKHLLSNKKKLLPYYFEVEFDVDCTIIPLIIWNKNIDNFENIIHKFCDNIPILTKYLKHELIKCCILYIYGGVYIHENYVLEKNFSVNNFVLKNNNCFCKLQKNKVNSDFIITKPKNKIFLELIKDICENGKFIDLGYYVNDDELIFNGDENIYYKNELILSYNGKREKKEYIHKKIPMKIWQTWSTKNLPTEMTKSVNTLKECNPDFEYNLYDDNDCEKFIYKHFGQDIQEVFNSLIPGAYKADLWRYCVLYIYGGIYLDIKFVPVKKFNFINLVNDEHFCRDRDGDFWIKHCFGIYNAILITLPRNKLMLMAIKKILKNYNTNNYDHGSLYISGPGLLGNLYENIYSNQNLDLDNDNSEYISWNGVKILSYYSEYRNEQSINDYKPYHELWCKRKIYDFSIEQKYNNFIHYLEKYKENSNILKIDRFDYKDNCLDRYLKYFNNSNIYNYCEINMKKNKGICFKDEKQISGIQMDLIIDSSLVGYWLENILNKIIYVNAWNSFLKWYKYLKEGGIYIIHEFNSINHCVDLYKNFFGIMRNKLKGENEITKEIILGENFIILKK